MRDYELVLVIDPDLTGADQKKLISKIKKIIQELKGKVGKTDEWGKRELAYPIKKKNLGYYFLLAIKLPPEGPGQIEGKLKLEEQLIRYLLVKKE
jgi:small subunit ribosomal protein S6